ncbi:MAG TPA: glycosyltransferase [Chitinophagaceae bacterium]|nr:glycosyltransferase [Chitinophagaceae bacterium]
MNRKVLYISYDGMTDPLGQSQVLPYIIELSKQGYRFTILSFEKKKRYDAEKKIIEKITQEASIRWEPLFFTARPPVLSKIYDRWQLMRKAFKLHRQEKFDIVHCRSYIASEAGLRLKQKKGVKFLFDMRGFWADERVDNGQWDLEKPFYKRIYDHYKKKEKEFLLNADGIVSLTQAAKDLLLSKPGYKNISVEVIPCCADLDHFNFARISKQRSDELRNELGILPGKKVIIYLGSIGGWYMTHEMFSFYKRLLLKHPDFVMLILTKDEKATVINEAASEGIPADKIFVRYAPREEVPAYLGISCCSIFFIRPTFSKTASSPTKHAELMGMGIPVICNNIGDTGNIIEATRTGIVVHAFSDNDYDKAVEELPQLLAIPKDVIRQAAFGYFDLKMGAKKYAALYSKILN